MRFPLDTIAERRDARLQFVVDHGERLAPPHPTGTTNTMYWASHKGQQQVRLFRWIDGQGTINWWDIGVGQWSNVDPFARTERSRLAGAVGSADHRRPVSGGGRISPDVDGRMSRPTAHTLMPRSCASTRRPRAVIDRPDIWSGTGPGPTRQRCPNACRDDRLHRVLRWGDRNPGHVVGARDDSAGVWQSAYSSDRDPLPRCRAKWGDYLTCRADTTANGAWVAVGYTLEGGEKRGRTSCRGWSGSLSSRGERLAADPASPHRFRSPDRGAAPDL